MTPRQKRFVDEYLVDLNAMQAALRAGYAQATAESHSYLLLRKPDIAAAIAKAQDERAGRLRLTQDYVLGNLIEIAERCLQKAPVSCPGKGKQDEKGRHVWSFNATTATRALELIGKHLGMFVDRQPVSHIHYAVSADATPLDVDSWQKRFATAP